MDNSTVYRSNRILPDSYHDLAKSRGFTWLGEYSDVRDVRTKTTWKCPEGHEWQAAYYKIKAGRGCPVCATKQRSEKRRLTPGDYHELATRRGFAWIGEYTYARNKTTWRCGKGHQWDAPYYSIKSGYGCPQCSQISTAQKQRFTAEHYHAVAAKWGISWIGEVSQSVNKPTRWRCSCGHEWYASYSNVKKGRLCPPCGDERVGSLKRKSPWDYADLGNAHNLIWLGPVVKSAIRKIGLN